MNTAQNNVERLGPPPRWHAETINILLQEILQTKMLSSGLHFAKTSSPSSAENSGQGSIWKRKLHSSSDPHNILCDIYSDILPGILADILSDIYFDIRSDILSKILPGTLAGIYSDSLSDIPCDILHWQLKSGSA